MTDLTAIAGSEESLKAGLANITEHAVYTAHAYIYIRTGYIKVISNDNGGWQSTYFERKHTPIHPAAFMLMSAGYKTGRCDGAALGGFIVLGAFGGSARRWPSDGRLRHWCTCHGAGKSASPTQLRAGTNLRCCLHRPRDLCTVVGVCRVARAWRRRLGNGVIGPRRQRAIRQSALGRGADHLDLQRRHLWRHRRRQLALGHAETHLLFSALTASAGASLFAAASGVKLPISNRVDPALEPSGSFVVPAIALDLEPGDWPILVIIEYSIAHDNANQFIDVMRRSRHVQSRAGARQWTLTRDVSEPPRWLETYRTPTWTNDHRLHHRLTAADRQLYQELADLAPDAQTPEVTILVERPPDATRKPAALVCHVSQK
ncbi:Transport transmembrane protein (plasmid) [Sinorhizobium alkalisoli]|nr:Transport transmembrane protein [Sinorhizobium alkalisoli]